MEQSEEFDLLEYVYAIWRRKWVILLIVPVVLAVAVYIIMQMPVIYRSTGTVLIERQAIPEQWVNSTITTYADERIQAIGQRVLTTEKLREIIEKFDLFSDLQNDLTPDRLVAIARGRFSIQNVQRSGQNSRNASSAAFRVSFDASTAEKAQAVASEMIALYLNENIKARTQAATDTRRFLEAEADRIERQLKDIEGKISIFKELNVGVLPEHQDINIQTYQRVEQDIARIDTTLSSLEERKIVLEASIGSARRALNASRASAVIGGVVIDPARQRLEELRAAYVSLQTRYSASHPDLKRLQREIAVLEAELGTGFVEEPSSAAVLSTQDDAAIIQLSSDLKSASNEQRTLRARRQELVAKLEELELRINKSPEVELEYRALVRDYENIQNKYNDIRTKQNSARVSQSLEEEEKGERFTLIEPPNLAADPHSPNYQKMYVMALGLAFLSGLGAVFGLEFLDSTIRNVRSVEAITNVPVIATVGYLETPQEQRRKSSKKVILITFVVLLVLGVLYLVKTYDLQTEEQRTKIAEMINAWVSELKGPM